MGGLFQPGGPIDTLVRKKKPDFSRMQGGEQEARTRVGARNFSTAELKQRRKERLAARDLKREERDTRRQLRREPRTLFGGNKEGLG